MTWTYTDPSVTVKDEVRFMVGDTDTAEELVQDEEITHFLGLWPKPTSPVRPPWLAAAATADAIAAKFARRANRSIGSLSIQAKQQRDHYVELAQQYRILYATDGKGLISGAAGNFIGIKAGLPYLSGGGRTYLHQIDGIGVDAS